MKQRPSPHGADVLVRETENTHTGVLSQAVTVLGRAVEQVDGLRT